MFRKYLSIFAVVVLVPMITFATLGNAFAVTDPIDPPAPPEPPVLTPITANFMDNTDPETVFYSVSITDGEIVFPDGWDYGQVRFDMGETGLIVQGEFSGRARDTVDVDRDTNYVTFSSDFPSTGYAMIHMVTDDMTEFQPPSDMRFITFKHPGYLGLAFATGFPELGMNRDSGLPVYTSLDSQVLEIFYGNTFVDLKPDSLTPISIDDFSVSGGLSTEIVMLPPFGPFGEPLEGELSPYIRVYLPPIYEPENTLTLTINGEEKELILQRKAFRVHWSPETSTLESSYYANKAYLYENQSHDTAPFQAYFQITFFDGDQVVGFRQVEVDDKELIDMMWEDESNLIEIMPIYGLDYDGTLIEGADRATVILTNGPIDFNSATLPSIEFGIGTGVEVNLFDLQ